MEMNHFHPRHEKYVTVLSQISKMDRMGGKPSAHPIPQADIRSLRLLMSYALQMRLCASTAALAGLAAQKAVLSDLPRNSQTQLCGESRLIAESMIPPNVAPRSKQRQKFKFLHCFRKYFS